MALAIETNLKEIDAFNDTRRAFPDNVTIQQLIEARVRQNPEKTAVICDHDRYWAASTFTYAQLNEKGNQVAHLLRNSGVRPGHIVGILTDRSFSMIIGIFGIIKAG